MLKSPTPSVADVFITAELARRAPKQTDHLQEKRALQDLAMRMADAPEEVLPRFVDLAMQMTGGISAGLSLYEGDDTRLFRWRYLRGVLSTFEGAPTPRNFSPCGVTLDENRPVLARHPERAYDWIADAGIVVPEVLLVPLYVGSEKPLGTLWIVAGQEGHFDAGHARAMTELATLVGIALKLRENQTRLTRALEEQERLSAEMDHRIKNLFSIAESMIRSTARTTSTKEQMVTALSGRLHALANAHSLVRRKVHSSGDGLRTTDLGEVVEAITRPHDPDPCARFTIEGPRVPCSDKAVDGIALVIHELATNASKYGALSVDEGCVDICWRPTGEERLHLTWVERGGPPVEQPPRMNGYGSRLVHATVTRQFGGTLKYDWRREGLSVTMTLPSGSLLV
ncbi:HWE histidine kinase domain-containing protein [Chelativorans sp. AA-79]|uniref:sensor histidine kinase n=1 Tax=Chelativorans sp. AA-79 TaxID=3028735 RepID=UPI0023F6ACD9|nr:HWE histidine kinase domain-containing protein [Chelativorans sp. AA-79]WEX11673.1 HWE histidine kinase domain-containing protein [Chelativorans sp. AA-79]